MAENIRHLFPGGEPRLLRPGDQPEGLESGGGGGNAGGMDGVEALRADMDGLKKDTAGVKTAVESLRGVMEGFKESLRAMQWALGITLVVGLAGLGWLITIGNARVGETNTRLDRFLECQAETAATANAPFDRLLEQRAVQPTAPIVIQMPTVLPAAPMVHQPRTDPG